MKRAELKKCCVCGKGVCQGGQELGPHLATTRLVVSRLVVNVRAVQRQTGLEMLVGCPAIAQALSPDENLLLPFTGVADWLICDTCALSTTVADLWERLPAMEKTKDDQGSNPR